MKQPSIVMIDYGVGNTYSIANAIEALGYRKLRISAAHSDIRDADALILPGVGAFAACAANLRERNLQGILTEEVLAKRKPILGICVGMQLMGSLSEEQGIHAGLDWIPGRVVKLDHAGGLRVPHVGWSDVSTTGLHGLFSNMPDRPNFYFDHSYHLICDDSVATAYCDYGTRIVSVINRENIFGVQFHPEKSQNNGLRLFRNFFNGVAEC
jgi:imidazole glycerol-phosphate synthase subunit HisH